MTSPMPQPALSPDMAAQLAKLRDIHLPDAVSWWPLAPGWWVLLAVVVTGIAGICAFEIRRRRSLKYQALQELKQLKQEQAKHLTAQELASELCVLIRLVVLNQADSSQYTSAHGEAWSECLAADPNGMQREIARFIANAPYMLDKPANESPGDSPDDLTLPSGKLESAALVDAAEQWIRRHA